MKIEKIQFNAVIPVAQYSNIQPGIELSDVTLEEGKNVGMKFIGELFDKYSEKGGLVAHETENVNVGVLMKSFNEENVEILFDPIAHKYTHNGKQLTSATEYIKRFYKPFDADTISSVLESKWSVPQKVIKELWESNGELTSIFGNVIHRALEFYERFKEFGEIISSQQDETENYCLPKHPILREIIKGFLEINKDEKGDVVTEVLLSDIKSGICGQADRIVILDKEKKICKVKDYKVNIGSEVKDKAHKVLAPFDNLPNTKISKYQLQMSLYANLLQKYGWTVAGLEVFVYEDVWKKFELPVLKIIE